MLLSLRITRQALVVWKMSVMNDNSVIGTNCERESERKRGEKRRFCHVLGKRKGGIYGSHVVPETFYAKRLIFKMFDGKNLDLYTKRLVPSGSMRERLRFKK